MKYKIGDVVKIKTWEQLKDLNEWTEEFERYMNNKFYQLHPDRNVEISSILGNSFEADSAKNEYNIKWLLTGLMIEGLAKEPDPIKNRFEILDL